MRQPKGISHNQTDRPSICFVALNSYNIVSKRNDINHIGGAEVQQWLISQWLVKRGFTVSFVTLDQGQPESEEHNGIRVCKAYNKESGIPILRFLHPRWTKLYSALACADADIYYQRGADVETGQIALWCRRHSRPFIFASASENDCVQKLPFLTSRVDRTLYRAGLHLADIRLAQTVRQQILLNEQFNVSSTIFRSVCQSESNDNQFDYLTAEKKGASVLWVGRIAPVKRFNMLLDVAAKCPDTRFDIVGTTNNDSKYASPLMQKALRTPNIRMHGYVPYSKMSDYYQRCKVLCCTSEKEGFPNTFLEAWRIGVPVISTFDPDDVIKSEGLGWVKHNAEEIADTVKKISRANDIWQIASSAAKRYFLEYHTLEANMPEFERLMHSLAKR